MISFAVLYEYCLFRMINNHSLQCNSYIARYQLFWSLTIRLTQLINDIRN